MSEPGTSVGPEKDDGHFANYVEYNKTLRAWFVTFGVGAIVIILANPSLLDIVKRSICAHLMVGCLLVGCALQILIALINKTISHYLALGEDHPDFKSTKRYSISARLSLQYWIDLTIDLASFGLFGVAVVLLWNVVLNDTPPIVSPPPSR